MNLTAFYLLEVMILSLVFSWVVMIVSLSDLGIQHLLEEKEPLVTHEVV